MWVETAQSTPSFFFKNGEAEGWDGPQTWRQSGVGVLHMGLSECKCVGVGVCAQYEEVSLALPDESPDGKHNYLPRCLPIISAREVQVSQLKRWTRVEG